MTDTLAKLIIEKAKKQNISIGLAESCTGGLISSSLTDIPGSSKCFTGSIVSYSNQIKKKILNINEKTLEQYGAVSAQMAEEMALGAKKILEVDISIATTGIAGPQGGSKEKPVGTIAIGWALKEQSGSKIFHFKTNNRKELKYQFCNQALQILYDLICQK